MMPFRVSALVVLVLICPAASAGKEENLEQLIARAESARLQDRPDLDIKIARLKTEDAIKSYDAGNVEAGASAMADAVTYFSKATDAAISSGKKLKDTEIALRKMAEKFRDLKCNLAFEDQPPVQQAIDRMEKMRTDLLSAMFGKKKEKP
jgi:hypothetical protein